MQSLLRQICMVIFISYIIHRCTNYEHNDPCFLIVHQQNLNKVYLLQIFNYIQTYKHIKWTWGFDTNSFYKTRMVTSKAKVKLLELDIIYNTIHIIHTYKIHIVMSGTWYWLFRVWGMHWPKTWATYYHAQLRLPDRGPLIKGLVVCSDLT